MKLMEHFYNRRTETGIYDHWGIYELLADLVHYTTDVKTIRPGAMHNFSTRSGL